MSAFAYAKVIVLIMVIGGLCVVLPIVVYLVSVWTSRRDSLLDNFDDAAIILYYEQFHPTRKLARGHEQATFGKDFSSRYGRRHYVVPLMLLTVLTATSVFAGVRTLQWWQHVSPGAFAMSPIMASAMAGGFTWVIGDVLSRLRRRDLTAADVYNLSFRILIAGPFGWTLAQLAAPAVGVPLAFLLGAFPTSVLFTIARRLAATKLGVGDDPVSGALELESLQSVTKTNAERYYDEGISTIVQLAYADPIDLTVRTNFDFNYVVDCISQALLWIYVGDHLKLMALYSLRGAQEAASLMDDVADSATKAQAMLTVTKAAADLNIDPAALLTTLQGVAEDPYTKFLVTVWH
jgi:hypothetical protein